MIQMFLRWLKGPRLTTLRIPEDVRRRAEKAGALEPPDWYAGRKDS